MQTFENLPIAFDEDSKQYNNLYARYCHTGCPGVDFEDNCAAPWECSSKGICRIIHENRLASLNKK